MMKSRKDSFLSQNVCQGMTTLKIGYVVTILAHMLFTF